MIFQPPPEQLLLAVLCEYIFIIVGIVCSEVIAWFEKKKLEEWKKEKMPEDLLNLFKKMFRILRPGYIGIILMFVYWSRVTIVGTWVFMFGVGLVIGDQEAMPRIAVEFAKHIKECVEREMEEFYKKAKEE